MIEQKLSEIDLMRVQIADLEVANAELEKALKVKSKNEFDHNLQILHFKIKLNEAERKLQAVELVSADTKIEKAKQSRRNLLKQYAMDYDITGDRWGYDPITGEIITD